MRQKRVALAIAAVLMLILGGCSSGSDNASVASGPSTPVPTTPPLSLPSSLDEPEPAAQATEPTVAPVVELPTAIPEPTATSAPAPVETAAEPTAAPTPSPVPVDEAESTEAPAPEPAATQVGVEPTSVPASVSPTGATISLGDFDVVNLVTGQTQNIAELSPSGPTMLWFWAPH